MDLATSIALVIAGFSLAASFGSLAVSLHVARRDRPHLQTSIGMALGLTGESFVSLSVANDGRHREIVQNFGIFVDGDRRLEFGLSNHLTRPLPCALDPGDKLDALIPVDELRTLIARDGITLFERTYAGTMSGRRYEDRVPKHLRKGPPSISR